MRLSGLGAFQEMTGHLERLSNTYARDLRDWMASRAGTISETTGTAAIKRIREHVRHMFFHWASKIPRFRYAGYARLYGRPDPDAQMLNEHATRLDAAVLRVIRGAPETAVRATEPPSATDTQQARGLRRQAVVMPILEAKGWTPSKLATRAGVSKGVVYEYLDGRRETMNDKNREALAQELGLEDLPF